MKRFLALILSISCMLPLAACGGKADGLLLAAPSYPKMAPYPDEMSYVKSDGEFDDEGFSKAYDAWWAGKKAQLDQSEGYAGALDGYLRRSIPALLSGGAGENRVCSPVNIYMALAMLVETTDGGSRAQLLELLGSDSLKSLRAEAAAVWNANYCDDGAVTSVLANSMWLSEGVNYTKSTLDSLARNYYASSFSGRMGSDELNAALQGWVNEQTGGLLSEQAGALKMPPETILALVSTIYYRAKWHGEFPEGRTEPQVFHAPGGDIERDFMHSSADSMYYWSDKFAAYGKPLEGSGSMWFLLPDEGVTPEQLLADEKAMEFLVSDGERGAESEFLIVNLAVPKFDIAAQLELSESLTALGVRDVFDPEVSDFSPLTKDADGVFLSRAEHAARVAIDEQGVTAAAYTVMMMAGAAMPPEEEVDFVLDRPFLFAITSSDGLPLFVGIVNEP
ncbi:MAG: serpin family protein [Butyricicoccus sp.]|nr:serpin family protein [Butyricicoccus sp.]